MSVEVQPSRTPHEFSDWWRAAGEHELRQLLFWVWDPIGVNEHFPVTADEYDRYAIEVATILASGASVPVLAEFLHAIARDRMGLVGPRPDAVAGQLHQWYRQSRDAAVRSDIPKPFKSPASNTGPWLLLAHHEARPGDVDTAT
jgi:hypothetical protein